MAISLAHRIAASGAWARLPIQCLVVPPQQLEGLISLAYARN